LTSALDGSGHARAAFTPRKDPIPLVNELNHDSGKMRYRAEGSRSDSNWKS